MYDDIKINPEQAKDIIRSIENIPLRERGVDLDNLRDDLQRRVYANCYPSAQGEAPAGQMTIPGLEGF